MKFLIKVNQGSHILLSSLPKKFLRKTYISYTTCGKYQYILVISGEGLGVGFSMGVGLSYTICSFTVSKAYENVQIAYLSGIYIPMPRQGTGARMLSMQRRRYCSVLKTGMITDIVGVADTPCSISLIIYIYMYRDGGDSLIIYHGLDG